MQGQGYTRSATEVAAYRSPPLQVTEIISRLKGVLWEHVLQAMPRNACILHIASTRFLNRLRSPTLVNHFFSSDRDMCHRKRYVRLLSARNRPYV